MTSSTMQPLMLHLAAGSTERRYTKRGLYIHHDITRPEVSPREILEGGNVIVCIPLTWHGHPVVMPHIHALVLRGCSAPASAGMQS